MSVIKISHHHERKKWDWNLSFFFAGLNENGFIFLYIWLLFYIEHDLYKFKHINDNNNH